MENKMSTKKIPQFDSIQAMAEFWDSHDLAEFEDQLEEVTEPVFERVTLVKIQLPKVEVEMVKKIAKAQGIGYTELIRDWVLERVHAG
jgi:predicted DNA binding CopG/RHH family protein